MPCQKNDNFILRANTSILAGKFQQIQLDEDNFSKTIIVEFTQSVKYK